MIAMALAPLLVSSVKFHDKIELKRRGRRELESDRSIEFELMAMANQRGSSSLKLLLLCFMFMALVYNAVVVAGQERKCEPSCTTPVYPPPPPPSPPPPSPPPPSPLLCPPPPAPCPWCYKPPPPPVPWCFKCNTPGYLYPTDPDYLLSSARRNSGAWMWAAAGGLLMVLAVAF